MAIVNQYKAVYNIENTPFEHENIYINATSMEKAVAMITTEKNEEPIIMSKTQENVLTEPTEETTVHIEAKSYYIDESGDEPVEVEIPQCIVYPSLITEAKRGSTIYFVAPPYTFEVNDGTDEPLIITETWNLDKWIYNDIEYTDNPLPFTVTYNEAITEIIIKAIYKKEN